MYSYLEYFIKNCFRKEKDLSIFENLPIDIVNKILEFYGKILYENGKYINQVPKNNIFHNYKLNYGYILVDKTPRPITIIF